MLDDVGGSGRQGAGFGEGNLHTFFVITKLVPVTC